MHFDKDFDIGSDGLTNRRNAFDGVILLCPVDVGAPRAGEGVELQGSEPDCNDLLGAFRQCIEIASAAPSITSCGVMVEYPSGTGLTPDMRPPSSRGSPAAHSMRAIQISASIVVST